MKSHLLNDEAILHFIARGYCVIKTNVAPRIHAQVLPLLKAMQNHQHGRLRYQINEMLQRVA